MNLETLKSQVDQLKDRRIRAQQRLDMALEQLKTAYGYDAIKDAELALVRAKKEIPILEDKLEQLMAKAQDILSNIENNTDSPSQKKLRVIKNES